MLTLVMERVTCSHFTDTGQYIHDILVDEHYNILTSPASVVAAVENKEEKQNQMLVNTFDQVCL